MSQERGGPSRFRPGENCWRVAEAGRVALLLETATYFEALREACEKAERSILITGWDFDRRERLGRGDDDPTLEHFFCGLLERKPDLEIWLLSWDYAFVYAAEREWFQEERLRHLTHERWRVHFDGAHPTGGSQHQKIVVVDDAVAFCGGIDLSRWRWDTADHAPNDDRRTDPDGEAYPPFHDAMLLVDGEAARALGELVRQRWRDAGSDAVPEAATNASGDPWPPSFDAGWRSQDVAIARTFPAWNERSAVREVEQLYLDTIAEARDYIYLENQYFTSRAITAALAERLRDADGPDVVLVLPRFTGGWLEQATMDVLRAYRVHALVEADHHERLGVYFPHQPGLPDDQCISVHAKLMVVDDAFLRVGSSNTSNRSMGLDSECDLALVNSEDDGARRVLHRLLAEHLDTEPETVAKWRAELNRLQPVVERLRREEGRSLRLLDAVDERPPLDLESEEDLVDPEEAIDAGYLVRRAVPKESKATGHRRLWAFLGLIVALLAIGAAWRWTPLGDWLDTDRIQAWLKLFESTGVRFAAVVALVAITTLAMVPLSALVIASALLMGPWLGFGASMAGALLSALIAFVVGEATGGSILARYGESRIHRLSERLSEQGILAVAVLRLMPVAPYTVVNLVAGASHLRLGKFLAGSVLGLTPGLAALSWFSGSLFEAIRNPSLKSLGLLAVVILMIGAGAFVLRRLLRDS